MICLTDEVKVEQLNNLLIVKVHQIFKIQKYKAY